MSITLPTPRAGGAIVPESIRPFRVETPEGAINDLHRRVAATRWPEEETVGDTTQGVQLSTVKALADHWLNHHDWSAAEARINAFPQFVTEIDGLDIHFVHVRSKASRCPALIVTHGWPGSFIEQLKIIAPLTDPTGHRRRARLTHSTSWSRRYRGTGTPETDRARLGPAPDRPGVDPAHAPAWLRRVRCPGWRLGERRLGAAWVAGAAGACSASPRTWRRPCRQRSPKALADGSPATGHAFGRRTRAWDQLDFFYKKGLGYANEMALAPADVVRRSPIPPSGLRPGCSTTTTHSHKLIARVFAGADGGPHARTTSSTT